MGGGRAVAPTGRLAVTATCARRVRSRPVKRPRLRLGGGPKCDHSTLQSYRIASQSRVTIGLVIKQESRHVARVMQAKASPACTRLARLASIVISPFQRAVGRKHSQGMYVFLFRMHTTVSSHVNMTCSCECNICYKK